MNILIFGATGDVGRRTVAEAVARGHRVTAAVRSLDKAKTLPAAAEAQVLDLSDQAALIKAMAGHDLAISALRPPEGQEDQLVSLTQAVVTAAAAAGTRILVVGGAARLKIPGAGGQTVLTKPGFLPPAVVPIAQACQAQFEWVTQQATDSWAYATPPAMLTPGDRTGHYRLGQDELVTAEDGNASISMEDFAVALIDEAETSRHVGQAFTVGY